MDANLNNPAAALLAASQPPSGNTPGAAPGLPGGKNDNAVGSQNAPAGESEFSSKIRSLQQDSVKETRASEAAGSGTEAPRTDASPPSDTAAAETKPAASTTDEQLDGDGLAPAERDGNSLPATGKELPVIELLAEGEADPNPSLTASDVVDSDSVDVELKPSESDLGFASAADEATEQPLPVADTPVESVPTPLPDAPGAEAEEIAQASPETVLAGNPAPITNSTGNDRSAPAPATSAPLSANGIGGATAAGGARSDGASMNFDGGANAQGSSPGAGENQMPAGSGAQRVAFSTEMPALAATISANASSTASATATLAELDTLAGSRPLQPQAGQEQFARGLGERMLLMADGGLQSARIKLSPENLGPLDIRIQVQDDATQVWFNASQSQTREILEQAMPRLRELLADQGMRLTDANVSGGNNGGSGEAGDGAQAPERDWRQPPPPGLDEQIAGRSLRQLIEARRLLDVYA